MHSRRLRKTLADLTLFFVKYLSDLHRSWRDACREKYKGDSVRKEAARLRGARLDATILEPVLADHIRNHCRFTCL